MAHKFLSSPKNCLSFCNSLMLKYWYKKNTDPRNPLLKTDVQLLLSYDYNGNWMAHYKFMLSQIFIPHKIFIFSFQI